jgi:hypothetical protein
MTTPMIGTGGTWLGTAGTSAADWLCLAAAPTFAVMALQTGVFGDGPRDMLCAEAAGASPLNRMVIMYMLMSAFHAGPWLKLVAGRRRDAHSHPFDARH